MKNLNKLQNFSKLVRYFILESTTFAGSGHLTSSLSATDLMVTLFFGGFFKYDLKHPQNPANDRLIFSKGHASPLFYALFAAASAITEEELKTFRKFESNLEGHPTIRFPFTEAATGSLGQGLSIGVGMALNAKHLDKLLYKTYVLLGDSEMAEGSVWEAIQIASYYQLDNLIGIVDVNRLGQRGQTMYGHDTRAYTRRISAFGWKTIVIDGHSFSQITQALWLAKKVKNTPVAIIAKTIKGKGISFLENKEDWHGKALNSDELEKALNELGTIDKKIRGKLKLPKNVKTQNLNLKTTTQISKLNYKIGDSVATRKAYGNALVRIFPKYPNMVVLDAEVSNSTYAETFKKVYPQHFFEMYIAEQNMVGLAVGLSRRGKIPFVSSFAAFLTRAFDQIRMSQYSAANIKFIGSHAGVSIGEDGPSQMGLEDMAMFRTILDSTILYPCDAVSTAKLVELAAKHHGIVYLRTTRKDTSVIYPNNEKFMIGGSKILKISQNDQVTVVGAGVTLHEALIAYEKLKEQKILIRVIDLYSVKPLDIKTLEKAASDTEAIITVEDHSSAGGIGEAVSAALAGTGAKIYSLAVNKMPRSGKPEELLEYEAISAKAIVNLVKQIVNT